ncbi:MAG: hypothetical protein M1834_000907 [Cirrosporium novae-zelandiae]|nr:MAG: hypothetical protein M1834_000907 [Cirrosporium novae-zelandiae]
MSVSKGRRLPSLFSTTDEQFHASLRRCVNNAFSMSSLIQYEPFVDTTTEVFLDQTEEVFASKSAPCNFTQWLQFYAFDVIGQITYSKRHGFIDSVEDVEGMVNYLAGVFSYSAPCSDRLTISQIGQMPWLDLVFIKNPILQLLDRLGILNSTFPVVKFAQARMRERLTETKEIEGKQRSDLLSMFLKAQKDHPDFMTDPRVLTLAVSMAFAGSDTTAISLSSVFYYLLKNPRCYQKLQQEIATAVEDGKIEDRPNGLITWAESQKLPYLDACIKEAFRMHPAAGLPLERVTPPQGTTICGEHIAGGTIVGCSAWIIHHRPEIFGIDADIYRPERWLEADEKCLKEMNGTMFQFGMGARTCIGKNISLLEIYKLVPSFLRRFDIHLLNPEKEWKLHNAWFVKQHDFYTTFTTKKMMMATTFAG